MKKLSVNKRKCIGCGTCVLMHPEIFGMGEDGVAYVKNKKGKKSEIEEAIANCPAQAISFK